MGDFDIGSQSKAFYECLFNNHKEAANAIFDNALAEIIMLRSSLSVAQKHLENTNDAIEGVVDNNANKGA